MKANSTGQSMSPPRGTRSAVLAGLVLALAAGLSAQTTGQSNGSQASGSQNPPASTPTAQSGPQSTPASAGTPQAQPAPGTTPVGGDQAAPQDNKQAAQQPAAQQPAAQPAASSDNPCDTSAKPGTTPVGGDAAPPPCADKKQDKKDKDKDAKDKKKDDDDENVKVDPDKVVEPGSEMVKIKPGSIEDVSSVGERDIGARGMGNWYSTESEIKMGKEYADELEKSARFITDPVVDEYVNRIGQNIVKNSDCKVPFTIKVIDSDEINAFALPGGFFYVNSGLILAADEEAELAGVMAHETAHVCAHHAAREMTRMNYAQLGTIPLIILAGGSWTGYGIYEASSLAIPIAFLQFSRDFEAQADYLGVQYMYRAGYDPQAFISFFEKVQALEKRKPGLVAKAFSDHPQTPDRILHTQEEIARILPPKAEYMVTTSEFDDIKARLARIENKRRLTDTKGVTRPSLRRAGTNPNDQDGSQAGNNGNNGNSGDGTDQPTLHRRDDQN
jgi:beta-barrel assembly-enhancing protease